jgi:hypothetical protein
VTQVDAGSDPIPEADRPKDIPALPPLPTPPSPPAAEAKDEGPVPQDGNEGPQATPLLDAALARAEAVQEQDPAEAGGTPVELPIAVEPAPEPVKEQTPSTKCDPPKVDEQPAKPEATAPAVVAPTAPAEPLQAAPEHEPKAINPEAPVPPTVPSDDWADGLRRLREHARRHAGEPGDAAEAWAIRARVLDWLTGDDPNGESNRAWNSVLAALSTATSAETADEAAAAHHLAAAVETLESFAPLQVRALRLCRKVQGFGQYEPLDPVAARAGQPLLIYCELEGLKYQEADDGFRSRLESRVEVVPGSGGAAAWSQVLGTAEDHCLRRRRDYFVNYRLALPAGIAPGPYVLRLTQTDLLSGRSVSATVDLAVTP